MKTTTEQKQKLKKVGSHPLLQLLDLLGPELQEKELDQPSCSAGML
jgi:hypothetical protein